MKGKQYLIWLVCGALAVSMFTGCEESRNPIPDDSASSSVAEDSGEPEQNEEGSLIPSKPIVSSGKNQLNMQQVNNLVQAQYPDATVVSAAKLNNAMAEVAALVQENNAADLSEGLVQIQLQKKLDSFATGTAVWPGFFPEDQMAKTPEQYAAGYVIATEKYTLNHTYASCAIQAVTKDGVVCWIIASITL